MRLPPPTRHIMMNSPKNGFWSGRSTLVTGASGLLGGWLVKELVEEGADVVALIRDSAPKSMLFRDGWINRINIVHGGLQDTALLRRAMSEYSVDTVFHLAAQTIVGVAKVDPVTTLKANVQGTWNVLEAARQTHVKQIVVASSDKAYGASDELPYREDHPLRGRYPYDVSKSCADLISTMYAATYGLPVVIARCANLFGGGDLNFSRTIPGVILAALQGERFLIRSDGKFVRDFLYVKDAATAYMGLAEKLADNRALTRTCDDALRALGTNRPEHRQFRNSRAVLVGGKGPPHASVEANLHSRRRTAGNHRLVPRSFWRRIGEARLSLAGRHGCGLATAQRSGVA